MTAHLAPRTVSLTVPRPHLRATWQRLAQWAAATFAAYGEREHHRGWQ